MKANMHNEMTEMNEAIQQEHESATTGQTYLLFRLAEESYAVEVGRVEEVLEYEPPTFVPRSPACLLGIVNVRGRLVPILDLRRRFGLPEHEHSGESRFIVMNLKWEGDDVSLGVLADAVEGVADLPGEALAPPPKVGRAVESEFLKSVARHKDRILLLMDVDRLLTPEYLHQRFAELTVGAQPHAAGHAAQQE